MNHDPSGTSNPNLRERFNRIRNDPSVKWALLLFVLAMIPRILWIVADRTRPFSDMEDYYLCAVNFLKGEYLAQSPDRLAYRAPLYPLFLAFCLRAFPGDSLFVIRLAQSAVGSISAVLVFFLSRQFIQPILAGERFGRLANYGNPFAFFIGLFYAWMAYPIFFCSIFMTETLFIALFSGWILWGERLNRNSPVWSFAGYSALLGLLVLTRPIAQFFLPILLWKIWILIPNEHRIRKGWIPSIAWMVPILPWTFRNLLVLHSFVFVSTNSGINLFIGNNPTFGYYESGYKEVIRRDYIQRHGPDEAGEDRLFMILGLDSMKQDPMAALKRAGYKFYFLYLLDKEPWPWEEYNQGSGLRFAGGLNLPVIRWKPWFFLIALWGIAYALLKRYKNGALLRGAPLAAIGLYTLACLIFFAQSRFRMPLEPLLAIYMGLAFLSLADLSLWVYGMVKK